MFVAHNVWAEVDKSKNKVEEFFIWKMSDELKLSPRDEKEFAKIVRELNSTRSKLSQDIQVHLKDADKAATDKEKVAVLKKYRQSLLAFNDLPTQEFDRMLKLLGGSKAVSYFILKQDISEKFKSFLTSPEGRKSEGKAILPEPKIIHEK